MNRLKRKLVIFLLIIFFILVVNLTHFSKDIKNIFYLISSPIQKTLWKKGEGIAGFFEAIKDVNRLKNNYQELRLRCQELAAEKAEIESLRKENTLLREALKIGLAEKFRLKLANIVSKDLFQDTILIDKGSKDGVSKGMSVITPQGVLVGKISEVYKSFSRVTLISNRDISFNVKILGTEATGIAKGKGNLTILLDFVPQEEEIKTGALLVSSSLGGIFPDGLVAGEIKSIEKSDVNPFQTAEAKPLFDINDLDTLFIVQEW